MEKLEYQSGVSRADEATARRRRLWKRVLIGLAIATVALTVLISVAIYFATQPTVDRVTLTITNNTPSPINDMGFSNFCNSRVVSIGPLLAGQTVTISKDYDQDYCLTGFSFDQSGQTFHLRLSGDNLEDGDTYSMVVTATQVSVICKNARGATTQFTEVPSTQPIVYLDQNGKPVPVSP